jgi:predicted RNA-binding protein YlxR (DUF448 family)
MKKTPLRRCLGCYESKPKNDLYRIVKNKEGEISIDKTGRKEGRGAYICNNICCLEKIIKAKKLEKEFSMQISDDIYETLRREINLDK